MNARKKWFSTSEGEKIDYSINGVVDICPQRLFTVSVTKGKFLYSVKCSYKSIKITTYDPDKTII